LLDDAELTVGAACYWRLCSEEELHVGWGCDIASALQGSAGGGQNLCATLGTGGYRARAGDHGFALLASGLAAGSGARADAGPLWDLP